MGFPSSSSEFGLKTKGNPDASIDESTQRICKMYEDRISVLPAFKDWLNRDLRLYEGGYYLSNFLPGLMSMQENFNARSSDVLVASAPKTGTTWLKALVFAIVNRTRYEKDSHPLLTKVPHECIPTLEMDIYRIFDPSSLNLDNMPSPRLFSTHVHYTSLPKSIIDSKCKIIYICRNPKDVLVSYYFFSSKVSTSKLKAHEMNSDEIAIGNFTLRDAYDSFCKGVINCGPYWDHTLSYYKANKEQRQNILFLKYEDLKRDPQSHVKKLAQFIGQPFSQQEEEEGVVQHIMEMCSFESLSGLQVSKTGANIFNFPNNIFYRKGDIGDWKNHLTSYMSEHMDKITKQKFVNYGLTL